MSTSAYQFALGTMPVGDRSLQAVEIINSADGWPLAKMPYDEAAGILLDRQSVIRRLNDRIAECADGRTDEEQEYVKGLRDALGILEGRM